VRVVPLEDFAPVDQIGVPVAAELQPEDPILTARRALAMEQTRAEVESARFEIEDLRRQVTDASAALAARTTTRRIWRPSSSDSAGFCWNMRPNYAVNSRSWSGPPSWTPRALLCCAKTPKRPSCSPGMAQAAGADAARTSRT